MLEENSCLKLPVMYENTGVEKINNIYTYIYIYRILTTRCHKVRVNAGIQTIVYIFKVRCFIANIGLALCMRHLLLKSESNKKVLYLWSRIY